MQFCSDENIDNGVVYSNHLMILGNYPVPKLWPSMINLTWLGRNTGFILLWRASYLPMGSNAQIVASLERLKFFLRIISIEEEIPLPRHIVKNKTKQYKNRKAEDRICFALMYEHLPSLLFACCFIFLVYSLPLPPNHMAALLLMTQMSLVPKSISFVKSIVWVLNYFFSFRKQFFWGG